MDFQFENSFALINPWLFLLSIQFSWWSWATSAAILAQDFSIDKNKSFYCQRNNVKHQSLSNFEVRLSFISWRNVMSILVIGWKNCSKNFAWHFSRKIFVDKIGLKFNSLLAQNFTNPSSLSNFSSSKPKDVFCIDYHQPTFKIPVQIIRSLSDQVQVHSSSQDFWKNRTKFSSFFFTQLSFCSYWKLCIVIHFLQQAISFWGKFFLMWIWFNPWFYFETWDFRVGSCASCKSVYKGLWSFIIQLRWGSSSLPRDKTAFLCTA